MKALLQILRSPSFKFISQDRLSIGIILFFNSIAALMEGFSFSFILLSFSAFNDSSASLLSELKIVGKIVDFLHFPVDNFFVLGITLAIFFQILRSSFNFIAQLLTIHVSTKWQMAMQKGVLRQILQKDFATINRHKSGDLVHFLEIPGKSFPPFIDAANLTLVSLLTACALILTMTFLSPRLTIFALLFFGILGYCEQLLIKKIAKASNALASCFANLFKSTVQILYNLRLISTFERQKDLYLQSAATIEETAKISKKMRTWNHSIVPVNEISGIVLVGFFLVLGQKFFHQESFSSLPLLLTFITIVYRLNNRIQVLFFQSGIVAFYWGHFVRLEAFLKEPLPQAPSQAKECSSFNQSIRFENVSLYYEGRVKPALQHFSYSFSKGSIIAIVGVSGAGKSSLLDLLLRLYEPTQGKILIDEIPISEYTTSSYRHLFGVVSQEVTLFHQTIEENIRFGRKASFEDIQKAASLAEAASFIEALPLQYKTLVGEKGYRLSGGEKQRLGLARALVGNPEILILDEATSHLDSISENAIRKSLLKMKNTKTILIAAHRLSTVIHADQILVLDKGHVVESGTHTDLITLNGLYSHLFHGQHLHSSQFLI